MAVKAIRHALYGGLAAATLFAAVPLARAATPYDGTWVIDIPPSTIISREDESACPALRFPVQIKDGRVTGSLEQVPSAESSLVVENGDGPAASMVTGTVGADGTVDAQWQNYHATGNLAGNRGEITVATECGPETAQAFRVTQ
jgi:hypothetical protein